VRNAARESTRRARREYHTEVFGGYAGCVNGLFLPPKRVHWTREVYFLVGGCEGGHRVPCQDHSHPPKILPLGALGLEILKAFQENKPKKMPAYLRHDDSQSVRR
jgi:hypothetical protein